MKALSLTQPWATALMDGIKTYETRSWYTSYRGYLAIHAAKGFPSWAKELARNEGYEPEQLPIGAILGIVWLKNCQMTIDVAPTLSKRELSWGDYSPRRWAWKTELVYVLPKPIPCRGALSLWTVPEPTGTQLRAVL